MIDPWRKNGGWQGALAVEDMEATFHAEPSSGRQLRVQPASCLTWYLTSQPRSLRTRRLLSEDGRERWTSVLACLPFASTVSLKMSCPAAIERPSTSKAAQHRTTHLR